MFGPIFFVEGGIRTSVVVPKLGIERNFERDVDARNYIQDLVESIIHKSLLLKKIDTLIKSTEVKKKLNLKYKSGENEIELQGDEENYLIKVNSANVLVTSDFQEAIQRYYREISNIIRSQMGDTDMSLQVFGEKVSEDALRKQRQLLGLRKKPGRGVCEMQQNKKQGVDGRSDKGYNEHATRKDTK